MSTFFRAEPDETQGQDSCSMFSQLEGGCGENLPVNRYFDEQRFGQFIEITTGSGIPLIASSRATNARKRLDESGLEEQPLDWQLYGGIPFQDALLGNEAGWRTPRDLDPLDVDLDRVLATGVVSELHDAPLKLSKGDIALLLSGDVVVVNLPGLGLRVALRAADGGRRGDLPDIVYIQDLAAFLADPVVMDIRGGHARLALTPQNVGELRQTGRTEFIDRGRNTQIRVAAEDPEFGPLMRQRSTPKGGSEKARTTPTPVVPRLGVYLPWRQRWELHGYARGRLLHTTPLAPREEVTVEVFTWSRQRRSLDQMTESDIEQSFESVDTTRDVSDVMKEATKGSDLQARADAAFDYSAYGATVSLSGGVSVGEKLQSVARISTSKIHESVTKAAARVRTRRTSRIVESRESGREERTTRRLTNASECHGLTIQYFEIVAGYTLVTEHLRNHVRPVVLVANPMRDLQFDNVTIRQYEESLRAALFDPGLEGGFAAARLTAARGFARELVCEKFPCDEAKKSSTNTQSTIEVDVRPLAAAIERLRLAWTTLRQATYTGVFEAMDDEHRNELEPTPAEMRSFRMWVTYRMLLQTNGSIAGALDKLPGEAMTPTTSAEKIRSLGAELAADLPQGGLTAVMSGMDARTDAKRTIARSHVFDYSGNPSAEANWWNGRIEELGLLSLDDGGLVAAVSSFLKTWDETFGSAALTPAGAAAVENAKAEAERLSAADRLEAAFGLRDSAIATEREQALQKHLSENANYYRHAVFVARPVAEQLVDLARMGVDIEMIEPRVLGSVGDSLVLPVSEAWDGHQELNDKVQEWLSGRPEIDPIRDDVTLPTHGIVMQTLVDDGCACGPEMRRRQAIETRSLELALERETAELALVDAEEARYRERVRRGRLDDPDRDSDPLRGNAP
ncbi:hypothetical protein ACF08O_31630 [Streptomyces paradoxus]|uniref:hypothetical protein n=1 Tax=Streptomyces paradoxus TaxID=66375 RepID=UPI0036F8FA75